MPKVLKDKSSEFPSNISSTGAAQPNEAAAHPGATEPQPAVTEPGQAIKNSSGFWLVLTAVTVLLFSLIPLARSPRFYFQDDTENGAYGVWYHLGDSLLSGKVPILNPAIWSSGNYTAEGQWGTWNPLIMAIGVLVYLAGNAVLVTTIIKVAILVCAGVGCFLLSRSFNVPPPLAFVAGIAVPLNGFTVFFDAPSWVTGALAWALVPYFWLTLKSMAFSGRNPLWPFLIGYLIVTIGYVAGTVAVGFVLLAVGIHALWRRQWSSAVRTAAVGLAVVLVAVVVYLPGVLTASVTTRSTTAIFNDNFMGVNLTGLLGSTIATALPMMPSWWWNGFTAPAPALYIAWFLPLIAYLSWRRIRAFAPQINDIWIFGVLSLVFVLLPTTIGPLRYPARFMPYLAMVCILLCVVLLSHALASHPSKLSLFGAVGAIAFGMYGAWAQSPHRYITVFLTGCLAAAGVAVIWWALRGNRFRYWKWSTSVLIAGVIAVGCAGASVLQHRTTDGSPLSKANVPADANIPKGVLAGVKGQVLVVGDALDYPQDDSTWSRTLMANTWYLSEASVINRYQLVGFTQYNRTLCLRYLGGTCPELLDDLFEKREGTGMMLVDELSVDNIQILKKSFEGDQRPSAANNYVGRSGSLEIPAPPEGWSLVSDDDEIELWSRDVPLDSAGGLVWTSGNTKLTEVSRTDTEVRLRVDEVPEEGGKAALSRLPWPGYTVQNGTMGEPLDGFLLTVDVPADSVGRTVVVSFTPPGWAAGVSAWLIGTVGILLWAAVEGTRFWRRRQKPGITDPVRKSPADAPQVQEPLTQ